MAWLLIKDNKIDNVVVYDGVSPWTPSDGIQLVEYSSDLPYDIGWEWNNGNPIPPPEPIPPTPVTSEPTVL